MSSFWELFWTGKGSQFLHTMIPLNASLILPIRKIDWPSGDSVYLNSTLMAYTEWGWKKSWTPYRYFNQRNGRDTAWRPYPRVSGVISPTNDSPQQWTGRQFGRKYCFCENCDITVGELQDALSEVAIVVQAGATRTAKEEAPILEKFLKSKLQTANVRPLRQKSNSPPRDTAMTAMESSLIPAAVGSSIQTFIPVTLCASILYLAHYTNRAGHPRERLMCDTMWNTFIGRTWLMMCTDLYVIVVMHPEWISGDP